MYASQYFVLGVACLTFSYQTSLQLGYYCFSRFLGVVQLDWFELSEKLGSS